ncbi:amidase family protein [Marivita sp.]|uniref:amidase family protein n=1 Tax=Marivita sp. TaxID=2003365 RepID=UPI003F6D18CE
MPDATALAAAIADGRTTAHDAMAASLARAHNAPGTVTVMQSDAEALALADAAAPGPFSGVPFLGKDLGALVRGLKQSAGSAAIAHRVEAPAQDSALFTLFRSAGLVPFGLTAVPEVGFALSTEPQGRPAATNPFDETRTPGGSSGGAAAAVARGIVAIAHATDAAGSIRVPAACCGLWGLKPSRGVSPMGPDYNNWLMGIASELVLARSLRDVNAALACVAKTGVRLAPRVAVILPDTCDDIQINATLAAARALEAAGYTVQDGLSSSPSDKFLSRPMSLIRMILAAALHEGLTATGVPDDEVPPLLRAARAEGAALTGTDLFAASRDIMQMTDLILGFFGDADAILMPVLSGPPPKLGAFPMDHTDLDAHFLKMEAMAPNAAWANVAGLPALAFPAGFDDGLPIGAQLIGRPNSDTALLDLAQPLAHMIDIPFPQSIAGLPT